MPRKVLHLIARRRAVRTEISLRHGVHAKIYRRREVRAEISQSCEVRAEFPTPKNLAPNNLQIVCGSSVGAYGMHIY